mmetsp:Transcript_111207/g.310705  ORF Transcript_111207/g.310705 Transcript_111207/m.310705 type:complete len:213 (-) Transcript_111207:648-1286(-)
MVCGPRRHYLVTVRYREAGHIRRAPQSNRCHQGQRLKDPRCLEQGRRLHDAAVDASVWRVDVEFGQDHRHAGGLSSLHRLFLGAAACARRAAEIVRVGAERIVHDIGTATSERSRPQVERPHQKGAACQGACLHHRLPQAEDAVHVWAEEEAEGAAREVAADLRRDRKRQGPRSGRLSGPQVASRQVVCVQLRKVQEAKREEDAGVGPDVVG